MVGKLGMRRWKSVRRDEMPLRGGGIWPARSEHQHIKAASTASQLLSHAGGGTKIGGVKSKDNHNGSRLHAHHTVSGHLNRTHPPLCVALGIEQLHVAPGHLAEARRVTQVGARPLRARARRCAARQLLH